MRSFTRHPPLRRRGTCALARGFTLLESLITAAIVAVILVALAEFVADISRNCRVAAEDPFAEAHEAFETVAANLAAATLAPYPDYADATGAFRNAQSTGTFTPDHLARRSDLDFVCGPDAGSTGLLAASGVVTTGSGVFFIAPNGYTQSFSHEGMERLLNAIGYFVEFSSDGAAPAFIPLGTRAWRWRLKQIVQSAESLQVFATGNSATWLSQLVPPGTQAPVLAENVISLVVLPELAVSDSSSPIAATYGYDSRDSSNRLTLNQLPPRVRLVLVAIDPIAAERLAAQDGSSPPQLLPAGLFQQAAQLSSDLATLDTSLTGQRISHCILQREISLNSAAWSDTPSP